MASSKPPGVQGSDSDTTNVMDGTLCRQESPKPGILGSIYSAIKAPFEGTEAALDASSAAILAGERWVTRELERGGYWLIGSNISTELGEISGELWDAVFLPDAPATPSGLSRAQRHVFAWLSQYRDAMISAGNKRQIDQRAIAGAIAWEALENVKTASIRGIGPGKVHIFNSPFSLTTIATEVENCGYLKAQSFAVREQLLQTAQGAIEYIGAIMGALAGKAAEYGYQIRCNPPILTTAYQAWDIPEWDAHLKSKLGQPLEPENMGKWVASQMDYLTDAVGPPALPCASGEAELRSQGWKVNLRVERNTNTAFA